MLENEPQKLEPDLDPTMQVIKISDDVEPFKGQIVAYRTTNSYLRNRGAIPSEQDADINFGLISDEERTYNDMGKLETGYLVSILISSDAIPSTSALIQPELDIGLTQMRLATKDELDFIVAAMNEKGAGFEYEDIDPSQLISPGEDGLDGFSI